MTRRMVPFRRTWMRLRYLALAIVLALTAVSPVVADSGEESITEVEGSITLSRGVCTIDVSTTDIHFGVWKWDGTQYVVDSGPTSGLVSYRSSPPRTGSCTITVSTAGLTNTNENSSGSIGPEHFAVWMDGESGDTQWIRFNPAGNTSVPWNSETRSGITLGLMDIPGNASPGTYEGTFVFTISAAD